MTTEPIKEAVSGAIVRNGNVSAKDLQTIALNAAVSELDVTVQNQVGKPELQIAVLSLAIVKAFRRVCKEHNITHRGRRHRVAKKLVNDFADKLSRYGVDYEEPAAGGPIAMPDGGTHGN